jgi:hypothetical protein
VDRTRLQAYLSASARATGVFSRLISFVFHYRRALSVNSFTRGLALGLIALAMLGITGCSTDNETEAVKISKGMGDPGEGTTKIDTSAPGQEGPASYPTGPAKTDMGMNPVAAKKKK